ncbi:P-loop NTPase [Gemmobacter serpentinus]|uniref:P-loop NTPase n=1 Tax=Gemmobacter serpentinus TaxID=2652247 RepID=UPI0018656C78|nr:P-loop NTPase [Gemmobacter serpentinus]
MTKHRILLSEGYSVADMVGSMRRDTDFLDRLDHDAPLRSPGISVFRGRGVPAIRPADPQSHAGPMEVFSPPPQPAIRPEKVWESLSPVTLDSALLAGNGLFPDAAQHTVTAQFDILRTRLVQAMQERGWRRIAVTSPTHGCGKSLIAANLALALARMPSARTVLLDLELRHPDLARLFGTGTGPMRDMLSGEQPLESHLRRVGSNLALAFNGEPVTGAAETLLAPQTAETLRAIADHLDPTVMVLDLPPALGSDDVISILPHVDAVLLVADATRTTAEDIRACERLFDGRTTLMGVVMNRAQESSLRRYRYRKS